MTAIVRVILGAVMLFAGRKLFWLFVGVAGFVVGFIVASQLMKNESEIVVLVIALAAGVVGAILAGFLQRLAVAAAGFLVGGYLAMSLMEMLGVKTNLSVWIIFLIGGVLGLILAAALFEWGLIILSSLIGADLIIEVLKVPQLVSVVIFVVLFILGLGIQAGTRHIRRPRPNPPART
jgi:Domain of unknown function (DUF4203)